MCGIFGTSLAYSPEVLRQKMARTNFRGPDYTGIRQYEHNGGRVSFGHNRLSIIDLDPRSNQPFDYNSSVSIVFNGEIYNFLSVKDTLHDLGYSFHTTSDTEVICAAYLQWGKKCLEHLNGMFAFVLYDHKKNQFFGARDRIGKKPFYYCHTGEGFEFSSQISSIQLGRDDLSISRQSIARYLAWGNIPDPDSIFNEVKKLKAGHCFTYSLSTNELDIECYWDINLQHTNNFKGSYEEAKQELDTLISDAVNIRLFADVPVGVFLSGGIDSSLVAAMAAKNSPGKVKTFSVKFKEEGFDESSYAQAVANHIGTQHTNIECSVDEGLDLIKNVTQFYDEPFADASAIPSMLLAKHTRKHVTVALSGDGGDESFLGYTRYQWMMNANKAFAFPSILRKPFGRLLHMAPNYRLKVIAQGLGLNSIEDFYIYSMAGLDNSWIESPFDLTATDSRKYLEGKMPLAQRMGDFDLKSYLIWDINTKVDRASMAFSLEARAPLLDYKVVDFARSLPVDFKFQKGNQKRILKDVLYQYAPKELFDRPKAGFTMPFKEWFKNELKEYVLDSLSLSKLKDMPGIKVDKVKTMIEQHMEGSWNRYPQIWKLLLLQQWLQKNGRGYDIK